MQQHTHTHQKEHEPHWTLLIEPATVQQPRPSAALPAPCSTAMLSWVLIEAHIKRASYIELATLEQPLPSVALLHRCCTANANAGAPGTTAGAISTVPSPAPP
mmetsp:Transcript_25421/g.69064  ORF Transcript_25421/g.69064 Transcript_25421/m.69064 type:complete len:103 (-) Transcript_25421:78-386(-)